MRVQETPLRSRIFSKAFPNYTPEDLSPSVGLGGVFVFKPQLRPRQLRPSGLCTCCRGWAEGWRPWVHPGSTRMLWETRYPTRPGQGPSSSRRCRTALCSFFPVSQRPVLGAPFSLLVSSHHTPSRATEHRGGSWPQCGHSQKGDTGWCEFRGSPGT